MQQREIDLANLNELNEFIVQHLRESILVVDDGRPHPPDQRDRGATAEGWAGGAGALLGEVSPRLLYLLETWRRQDLRPARRPARSSPLTAAPSFGHISCRCPRQRSGPGAGVPGGHQCRGRPCAAVEARVARTAERQHRARDPQPRGCDEPRRASCCASRRRSAADDRHLTDIIEKNAARVSQIIENVLQLSRRDTTRQERIALAGMARDVSAANSGHSAARPRVVPAAARRRRDRGAFRPFHLHQVLWNLCDNALKHAADGRLGARRAAYRPHRFDRTPVSSKSPTAASASIRRNAERIFEPFFTDRRRWNGPWPLHFARAVPDERRVARLRGAGGRW